LRQERKIREEEGKISPLYFEDLETIVKDDPIKWLKEKIEAKSRFEEGQRTLISREEKEGKEGKLATEVSKISIPVTSSMDELVDFVISKCPRAIEIEQQLFDYYTNEEIINMAVELGVLTPQNMKRKTTYSLCGEIANTLSLMSDKYAKRLKFFKEKEHIGLD
jgi:hypothetical protein